MCAFVPCKVRTVGDRLDLFYRLCQYRRRTRCTRERIRIGSIISRKSVGVGKRKWVDVVVDRVGDDGLYLGGGLGGGVVVFGVERGGEGTGDGDG